MSSIIQHQSIAAPKIATLSYEEYDKKRSIQKDEARIAEDSEKRVALWRRKRGLPSKSTFHPFPRLPLELRLKVWTTALPGPSIVELRFAKYYLSTQYDFVTTEFPIILHVSQESRKEALRSYQLAFHRPEHSIPVYFNFKIDILLLRLAHSHFDPGYYPPGHNYQIPKIMRRLVDKEKVQNLAISLQDHVPAMEESMLQFMLYFPNLEEVTVLRRLSLFDGYHLGKCSQNRSCFIQPDETFDTEALPETDFYHCCEIQLAAFLNDWRSGNHSFPNWREPLFKYSALCQRLLEGNFYCPPLSTPRRQIQTHSAGLGGL